MLDRSKIEIAALRLRRLDSGRREARNRTIRRTIDVELIVARTFAGIAGRKFPRRSLDWVSGYRTSKAT